MSDTQATNRAALKEFLRAFEDASGRPVGECYGKLGRDERLAEFIVQSVNAASRIRSLFDAIAHGSEDHRAWLKKALDDHFAGRPVEAPRVPDQTQTTVFEPENTAPENRRVLIFGYMPAGHDEMAMGWKDRMNGLWYFAPQGELVPFKVEQWCVVPEPKRE
jgi:hypothetical protein